MAASGWGHDWLAAGCGTIVKVWDPNNPAAEFKLYEGTTIHSLDFSHNNKVLAVASDKGQVVLYSSKAQDSGSHIVSSLPLSPEPGIDSFNCVNFAPDGSQLTAGASNGTVHIWNLRAGGAGAPRIKAGLSGGITSLAIDKGGNCLVATSSSGNVHVYEFQSGVKAATLQRGPGPSTGNACFSLLAPLLAVGYATGAVTVWDANNFERLTELSPHKAGVTGLALSETAPDLVISCGSDGVFKCCDLRTGKEPWSVMSRHPYTALSAKHDGQFVALGNMAGAVLIHDVRNVRNPVATQQFNDSRVAVSAVQWQRRHSSRSSRPSSSSTAAAATSTVGNAPILKQQQQQPVMQNQRSTIGVGAASATHGGTAGGPLRSPGRTAGRGHAGEVLEHEPSTTSASTSQEFGIGMRAFSPVQLYGDEEQSEDAATSAHQALPSIAAPAGTSCTPDLATPATSTAGPAAPFMFTPGIGLGIGSGAMPSGVTSTPDLTPVSRPNGLFGPPGSNMVPPAAAAAAAPGPYAAPPAHEVAAPATGTGRRGNMTSSSIASKAATEPSQRQPTGARTTLPASVAVNGTAAASGGAATAAASGGGIGAGSSSSRGVGGTSSSAAANSSRPNSRAAGTAAPAGLSSSSRRSNRGLSDSAAEAAAAAAAARGSSGLVVARAAAAADGPGSSRPSAGTGDASVQAGGFTGAAGLREDVFKQYIDQQMEAVQASVRNMHMDMLKQFHQAQMDLESVVDGLAQRQDQLAEAVTELTAAVQGMRAAKQLPVLGTLGITPWI